MEWIENEMTEKYNKWEAKHLKKKWERMKNETRDKFEKWNAEDEVWEDIPRKWNG